MKPLFDFTIRLFLAFLLAKACLHLLGVANPAALLGLALALVGFSYLVKFLEAYYQRTWQSQVADIGWKISRFFIGLNQLRRRRD